MSNLADRLRALAADDQRDNQAVDEALLTAAAVIDAAQRTSASAGPRVEVDVDELKRLYVDEGLSIQQVVDRTGVKRQTVSRRLRAAGVALRPSGGEANRFDLDIDELKRLHIDEQLTLAQIGKRLGIQGATVAAHLRRAGVEVRPTKHTGGRPRATVDVAEAVRLYVDEQLPVAKVAEQVGVHPGVVRARLIEAGVTIRKAGRPRFNMSADEIVRLRSDENLTVVQIAERFGVHPGTVGERLLEGGVNLRSAVTVRTVTRSEIVAMIETALASSGLDLARFTELGRTDQLVDPNLRDLWLIWGAELTDIRPAAR